MLIFVYRKYRNRSFCSFSYTGNIRNPIFFLISYTLKYTKSTVFLLFDILRIRNRLFFLSSIFGVYEITHFSSLRIPPPREAASAPNVALPASQTGRYSPIMVPAPSSVSSSIRIAWGTRPSMITTFFTPRLMASMQHSTLGIMPPAMMPWANSSFASSMVT